MESASSLPCCQGIQLSTLSSLHFGWSTPALSCSTPHDGACPAAGISRCSNMPGNLSERNLEKSRGWTSGLACILSEETNLLATLTFLQVVGLERCLTQPAAQIVGQSLVASITCLSNSMLLIIWAGTLILISWGLLGAS